MGNGGSKPEQHIFSSESPIRFSQSVLESLQNSPENDSTRAQTLVLKERRKVNEELTRTRDSQAKQLLELTESLTTKPESEPKVTATPFVHHPHSLAYHLSSPFYHDFTKPAPTPESLFVDSGRSYDSVNMEVEKLKETLEGRKKLQKVSPEVEKAQKELVQCLRAKDRRPLDCWQEVEAFKAEVSKLEKAFVERLSR